MEETLTIKKKTVRKMEDLSSEVIQEILSRLPINSVFESRCVCSTWRNISNEPLFANMHFAQSSQNQNSGLILQSFKSELYAIQDCETCDIALKLSNLPFKSWLPNFKLIGSFNGFICLVDVNREYRSIFICNPVTGEYIKLPDNATFGKVNGVLFGFGFDPENKQHKVVRVRFVGNGVRFVGNGGTLEVEVHTLGTDSWRSIGFLSNTSMYLEYYGVLVEESLHWLGFRGLLKVGSIVSVNLRDEKLRLIQPPPFVVGMNKGNIHLGSLGGCLSLVDDRFWEHFEIWVMKDYGVTESWNKVFNIKRHIALDKTERVIKIVGMQKDGKILFACANMALFSYDPQSNEIKDLIIPGLPNFFKVFPYVPTLVSLKDACVCRRGIDEEIKMEI